MKRRGSLHALLWSVGLLAVIAGFVLLFDGGGEITLVDVVSRSVGGSFIFCGLIAWRYRPDSRSGLLMTLTGFAFMLAILLAEIGRPLGDTLAALVANWWVTPFAMLVLGFPSGHLTSRLDRLIVWAFVAIGGVLQFVWLLFLTFPEGTENLLRITADPGLADAIDRFQRGTSATLAVLLAIVVLARWIRAAPPLRRLLLPSLAGSVAALVLGVQGLYRFFTDEFMRSSEELTAFVLVSVPLAYLLGMLRAQLARAGMSQLIVELERAPDSEQLGRRLSRALGDPSLELVHWLPGFECYVDAEGLPVLLPEPGTGRVATPIDHDGAHVAALIHDAALTYEPELLDVVCAAANVAFERERLRRELESRIAELAGSRARLVEAGDEARRKIERDLHDGAQQRLVALAIALQLTEGRIRNDPETAAGLVAAAREEVTESLRELRELAHGIHPAVLEHGLGPALDSLASRSATPVSVSVEVEERLPRPIELAAYFVASEALANVGKHANASCASVRVRRTGDGMAIEISDDGCGGASVAAGSGLRGLADRVEAVGGSLRVSSPPGAGTVLVAELPCEVPATREM